DPKASELGPAPPDVGSKPPATGGCMGTGPGARREEQPRPVARLHLTPNGFGRMLHGCLLALERASDASEATVHHEDVPARPVPGANGYVQAVGLVRRTPMGGRTSADVIGIVTAHRPNATPRSRRLVYPPEAITTWSNRSMSRRRPAASASAVRW